MRTIFIILAVLIAVILIWKLAIYTKDKKEAASYEKFKQCYLVEKKPFDVCSAIRKEALK